jgi:hypothetical protein
MQVKITMRYHPTPFRMAIKRTRDARGVGVCKPLNCGTWVTEAVKEWGDY